MKNIIKTTLMMLLAGSIITACNQKTEYPEPNTTAAVLPVGQTARMKFIHASPDSPEMKFFVNNVLFPAGLTNTLTFGQDSPYATVDVVSNTRLNTTVSDMTKVLFRYTGLDGVVRDIKDVAFRTSGGGVMGTGNFAAAAGESYSVFYTDETTRPASPDARTGRSTDIGGPLLDYILADASFNRPASDTRDTEVPFLIPNPANGVIVPATLPGSIIIPKRSAKLRFCNLSPYLLPTSPPTPVTNISVSEVNVVIASSNIQDVNGNVVATPIHVPLPAVNGVIEAPSVVLSSASMNLFTSVRYRDLHTNPRQTFPPATNAPRQFRSLAYIAVPEGVTGDKLVLKGVELRRPGTTIPFFTMPDFEIEKGKSYTLAMIGRVGVTTGANKFEVKVIKSN